MKFDANSYIAKLKNGIENETVKILKPLSNMYTSWRIN